jgi:hypothetical protein
MVANSTTFPIRLSPSGPEIGNPPAVVGVGDGSQAIGRQWQFQGTGSSVQINSGTGSVALLGLDALPVNLLPGYNYNVSFVGFTSGTGGDNYATILGSSDNGATYPHVLDQGGAIQSGWTGVYVSRKVDVAVPANTVIDHVKVEWNYHVYSGNFLEYDPDHCSLVILESSYT